jgi:hypothetical protein
MKWTQEKIKQLKDNYSNNGSKYCSELIGLPENTIKNMVIKLMLKLSNEMFSKNRIESKGKTNIDYNEFIKLDKPEIIYFLGLFWADGFMYRNKNNSTIGIGIVEEDMVVIESHLDKIGNWTKRVNKKKKELTWKPTKTILTNNKRIFDFLLENDYGDKSSVSAYKIISKIPKNLLHYFFRGLSDGDGCFYLKTYKPKKGSTLKQFSISSTKEQDWSYVENLFNDLSIKYSIYRNGSGSQIRITNFNGIRLFGEYIYCGYIDDEIGLSRKYNKYCDIIQCSGR